MGIHTSGPPDKKLTSRFATTAADLEIVLRLRHAYFKDKTVSSDESYQKCWERNPYTMKTVYDANQPVGYWSLVPTTRDAYQSFLTGGISHEQMLTSHCLPWSLVNHHDAYIYIVGAVVPPRPEAVNNLIRGRVISDWLSFVSDLLRALIIKGLFGYPSREHGYKLLEKLGFTKSDVLIGNDEHQPIFFVDEARVSHFRDSVNRFMESQMRKAPAWDAKDRENFLSTLGV